MPDSDWTQIHALIEGRVQGVGFRYFVYEKAVELELAGWVRNTFQDEVEVLAEGNRMNLEKFLRYLSIGPQMAFVTSVNSEWHPPSGVFKSFKIEQTV